MRTMAATHAETGAASPVGVVVPAMPISPGRAGRVPPLGNGPVATVRGSADVDGDGTVDKVISRSWFAGEQGYWYEDARGARAAATALERANAGSPWAVFDLTDPPEGSEDDPGSGARGYGEESGYWVVPLVPSDRDPNPVAWWSSDSASDTEFGGWSNPKVRREHGGLLDVALGAHTVHFGDARDRDDNRIPRGEYVEPSPVRADLDAPLPSALLGHKLLSFDNPNPSNPSRRTREPGWADALNSFSLGTNALDAITGFGAIVAEGNGTWALLRGGDGTYWATSVADRLADGTTQPMYDQRFEPGTIVRTYDDAVKAVGAYGVLADVDGVFRW